MSAALRSKLVPRQVLVNMRPVPRTIADSRLVLRELQKFGEVATFLNLKVWWHLFPLGSVCIIGESVELRGYKTELTSSIVDR